MAKKHVTKKRKKAKQQLIIIISFAVGILITALSVVPGQNIWSVGQDFMRGIFSISSFLIGPIIIFLSILAAKSKDSGYIIMRGIQCILGLLLICAGFQMFTMAETDLINIGATYISGISFSGGGVFSLLLCGPLYGMFGKSGALITIVILIFIYVMVITGITLIQFLRAAKKPVTAIGKVYDKTVEEFQSRQAQKKFDIDIPLDGGARAKEEIIPVDETDITDKPYLLSKIDCGKDDGIFDVDPSDIRDISSADSMDENVGDELKSEIEDAISEKSISYEFPPVTLLDKEISGKNTDVSSEQQIYATRLVNTLKSFGVEVTVSDVSRGPSVTRFELQPSVGVRINKITNLADDIALSLAAESVRIEAPIPGKSAVGIEIPNKVKNIVRLREVIESPKFASATSPLTYALGKDIAGDVMVGDISKMPHMLIAGSTGSGKSVCVNTMLISLLYKSSPDDIKLLMIDPKVVELSIYNGIPHLLVPVVNDPKSAAGALAWAVGQMMQRYKTFADNDVKDITGYNELAKIDDTIVKMPHVVIVIDELADLMMASPKEVEESICRLAQMARAAGMHLVIATQRPSVDVITGLIKANIPSRIAFAVSSQTDSRVILDTSGAEKLLGKGDMLYSPIGCNKPTRIQGCFVSENEIKRVISFVKGSVEQEYDEDILDEIKKQAPKGKNDSADQFSSGNTDDMINDAIQCVIDAGQASTSYLQRRLKVGYARAARLIDEMEDMGIVGPFEGSKPRHVLLTKQEWMERQMVQDE